MAFIRLYILSAIFLLYVSLNVTDKEKFACFHPIFLMFLKYLFYEEFKCVESVRSNYRRSRVG